MSYVTIPWSRLALSAALLLVAVALSRRSHLGLEGALLWGSLRGAIQLVAVGLGLTLLFRHESAVLVGLVLLVMTTVAAFTSVRRVEHGPSARALLPGAFVAIAAAGTLALVPVFVWIVPVRPWFAARYVVPVAGMLLSSAMNVVALVFERLFASAQTEADSIEAALSLGATPTQALAPHVRTALRAALTPTINGLLTVGLVALPGMMTGQIVSGIEPTQAVRYQIVILYQLVMVAAVAGTIAAYAARRLLFDERARLVLPEPQKPGPARRTPKNQDRR
jgi:putative ABC transport system permease protein